MKFREVTLEGRGHKDADGTYLEADIAHTDHICVTGVSKFGARLAFIDGQGEQTTYRFGIHHLSDGDSVPGLTPEFALVRKGSVITLTEVEDN